MRRRAGYRALRFLCYLVVFGLLVTEGAAKLSPHSHLHPPTATSPQHQDDAASRLDTTRVTPGRWTSPPRPRHAIPHTHHAVQEAMHQFDAAIVVATLNVVLNAFRPDPWIPWPMRLPRILWECAIAMIANSARKSSSSTSSSLYLLLAFMTFSTAAFDLFFWAPLFASTARFTSCSGGSWWSGEEPVCRPDYVTGYGRTLVAAQCVLSGLVYLYTSVTAWNLCGAYRDEQRVSRELIVLEEWDARNRLLELEEISSSSSSTP